MGMRTSVMLSGEEDDMRVESAQIELPLTHVSVCRLLELHIIWILCSLSPLSLTSLSVVVTLK